ncbi:hypothetical protein AB0G60_02925 [Streptomyces angustmyceticus]|uniref:Uncharacterized protein n=1 Tax=Streptomyces angustmyceticus TaxID=285578 RepID=A0A5J4L181_9ACTN|nr:hypothetical protein [Streptomyces angustmyceticus]UAL65615.1 hypothetical protein K7396_02890 [Streptomyces angustmyceticus]GES27863.1 hypothetical protein San01_03500 [Streptomyces angustmyceticus]
MAKQSTEHHTPLRQLRIPDEEWKALGAYVGDRERTRVVREFIRWYLHWPGAKAPDPPRAKEPVTVDEQPADA